MAVSADPAGISPAQARSRFRAGFRVPTAGWSAGYTQANLIAVPSDYAFELLLFAQRNPKACPVLDVLEPGNHCGPLFPGGDIRTDLPAYRVYVEGELVDEPGDVVGFWTEDLVAFVIGCSFTFEAALQDSGIAMRHIEQGCNVPMYRTDRSCRSAGRISGPLVVSMRPVAPERVADAVCITSRYPSVHGAPVHVGDPAALGIADLAAPDFGEPVTVPPGEIPVFWACGVTPQAAVMQTRPPLAIGHAPGHMLITDLRDADLVAP